MCCFFLAVSGGCSPMKKNVFEGKEGVFALIYTKAGTVALELFYKEAPLTVVNFVGLAEGTADAAHGKPFYDGLKFHRVISRANGDEQDFMIQGGDPKGNGTGGPGYSFPDEITGGLTFDRAGLLAMANAGPNTNGSQFFITIVPTPWLNGKHTIFGRVISGQDAVNKIRQNELIQKIEIVRQGNDAEKFSATQKDFDALLAEANVIEKKFPNFQKNKNGIYWKTTKTGSGAKIGKGKTVAVDYKGYLIGGYVFDSSAGREPLSFVTAAGQMISGFDEMVQDMQVNESRTMVIPPELAYGERGYPGVIPENAYIAFDVTVKSAK